MWLIRHRLAVLTLAGAFAATGLVFAFARPTYAPPNQGHTTSWAKYRAPIEADGAEGWVWKDGTPGFRFGHDETDWLASHVRPGDLLSARRAAKRAGVDPTSLRVLNAIGAGPQHVFLALLAGNDRSGRTCIGVVVTRARASFFCPEASGGSGLGPQAVILVVVAAPPLKPASPSRPRAYPFSLLGIARGDVTRIVISQAGHSQPYHDRAWGYWGTFMGNLDRGYPSGRVPSHPWQARLDLYGRQGLLGSFPIRLSSPAVRLITLPVP